MTVRSGIFLCLLILLLGITFAPMPAASDPDRPAVAEREISPEESLNPFVDLVRAKRESEAKLREALKKPVTIAFDEIPLNEAMKRLGAVGNVTILLNQQSLAEEGVPIDEPVFSTAKNITLHQALKQVVEPLGLDYEIENEVIQITTILSTSERLENRHYEVADLIAWEEAHRYSENYALSNTLFSTHRPHNWLLELIEDETSGPWVDVDGTGGELEMHGTVLSVRQTKVVHDEIPPILKMLRMFIEGGFGKDGSVFLQSLSQLESDLAARRALAKRVNLDFDNLPLKEIADRLTKDLNVPVVLDEAALREEGFNPASRFSINVKDVTLDSAFELMFGPHGLTVTVSEGRLVIYSSICAEEKLHTAAYDERDLIREGVISRDFFLKQLWLETAGPWIHVDATGGTVLEPLPGLLIVRQTEGQQKEFVAFLDGLREREKARKAKGLPPRKIEPPPKPDDVVIEFYNLRGVKNPQQVKRAIYDLVESKSWEAGGGDGSVRIINDLLVVKNTAAVHRKVHAFLIRLFATMEKQSFEAFNSLTPPIGNPGNFDGGGGSGFF